MLCNSICFHLMVVFAIVFINKSMGVSIPPNNINHSAHIKPSPVDEIQQSSEERPPTETNQSHEDKSKDFFTKRESNKKNDEKLVEEETDQKEKSTRRIPSPFSERDKPSCCGSRFEVSGRLENPSLTTRASDTSRYPENGNRYENRPDNRYSWQTYPRPGGASASGSSLYGSQGNPPDRYGSRPPYGPGGAESEYGRPSYSGLKPGRPGYGYGGGGGYGDNGAYGSIGFEVSHRPGNVGGNGNSGGLHFSGGNRPPGGYGVYGTVGEQDEFPADPNAEGGRPPPHSIQTQKAVALKALAGVALIGAAAALAANPALIPLGVVAGRKRRSVQNSPEFNHLQFPYKFIFDHVPRIEEDEVAAKFWKKPKCLARLACEVQREFVTRMSRDKQLSQDAPLIKRDIDMKLSKLVDKDVLRFDDVRRGVKLVTKIAREVGSAKGSCEIFFCSMYVQ